MGKDAYHAWVRSHWYGGRRHVTVDPSIVMALFLPPETSTEHRRQWLEGWVAKADRVASVSKQVVEPKEKRRTPKGWRPAIQATCTYGHLVQEETSFYGQEFDQQE